MISYSRVVRHSENFSFPEGNTFMLRLSFISSMSRIQRNAKVLAHKIIKKDTGENRRLYNMAKETTAQRNHTYKQKSLQSLKRKFCLLSFIMLFKFSLVLTNVSGKRAMKVNFLLHFSFGGALHSNFR